MEKLLKKYSDKLKKTGLIDGNYSFAGLDDEIFFEGAGRKDSLHIFFDKLSINSLLYAQPKEPYRSIINYFAEISDNVIEPSDCETRTFLHDLPLIKSFDTDKAVATLKRRKCVIVKDQGIITFGSVSPEQCYVTFSSVCFSTFVKFFSDYLSLKREGKTTKKMDQIFRNSVDMIKPYPSFENTLSKNIFKDERSIYSAISEAGKLTVDYGLVDSFFGNVSAFNEGILYISQTGSSLDELDGHIDACPKDGSTCSGLTASSELSAHLGIVSETETRTILHGHPLFSVIMSMDCNKKGCANRKECHRSCREHREIKGIPIVSGEVGTGPFGLCNTVPPALSANKGVIVYGHGVFTTGREDFNAPFKSMLEIEKQLRDEYLNLTL